MRSILTAGILLSSLASRGSSHHAPAPECAVGCSRGIMEHHKMSTMDALCSNVVTQRALFLCIVNSCPSQTYGPALVHSISECSTLGATISSLHPVELHHFESVQRQPLPIARRYEAGKLSFAEDITLSVDCTAGSDGVLTLSLPSVGTYPTNQPSSYGTNPPPSFPGDGSGSNPGLGTPSGAPYPLDDPRSPPHGAQSAPTGPSQHTPEDQSGLGGTPSGPQLAAGPPPGPPPASLPPAGPPLAGPPPAGPPPLGPPSAGPPAQGSGNSAWPLSAGSTGPNNEDCDDDGLSGFPSGGQPAVDPIPAHMPGSTSPVVQGSPSAQPLPASGSQGPSSPWDASGAPDNGSGAGSQRPYGHDGSNHGGNPSAGTYPSPPTGAAQGGPNAPPSSLSGVGEAPGTSGQGSSGPVQPQPQHEGPTVPVSQGGAYLAGNGQGQTDEDCDDDLSGVPNSGAPNSGALNSDAPGPGVPNSDDPVRNIPNPGVPNSGIAGPDGPDFGNPPSGPLVPPATPDSSPNCHSGSLDCPDQTQGQNQGPSPQIVPRPADPPLGACPDGHGHCQTPKTPAPQGPLPPSLPLPLPVPNIDESGEAPGPCPEYGPAPGCDSETSPQGPPFTTPHPASPRPPASPPLPLPTGGEFECAGAPEGTPCGPGSPPLPLAPAEGLPRCPNGLVDGSCPSDNSPPQSPAHNQLPPANPQSPPHPPPLAQIPPDQLPPVPGDCSGDADGHGQPCPAPNPGGIDPTEIPSGAQENPATLPPNGPANACNGDPSQCPDLGSGADPNTRPPSPQAPLPSIYDNPAFVDSPSGPGAEDCDDSEIKRDLGDSERKRAPDDALPSGHRAEMRALAAPDQETGDINNGGHSTFMTSGPPVASSSEQSSDTGSPEASLVAENSGGRRSEPFVPATAIMLALLAITGFLGCLEMA
ncbi:hypothetical protein B0J13DRAFT_520623 [Dactylonectria estremocensis]|uniref:Uncharacterized protein n=1 Tax=Dactylonectria estremocensis TaxID=1079267 RepID=A0A9P9JBE2_9HYPO|nr:hypothetical protein B0J13DRAFT_520623 [Dactylonectria estremocensis]